MKNQSVRLEEFAAVVCRDAFTGKWIICREINGMIESDELARRRGQWTTRKAAVEAAPRVLAHA